MEAPSQSQMIDQESKGRGGEGRPRWAENLVQTEGHRRTWKAKREIAAELSVCWCARCQTAVGAGGCFWSLSMHPRHTHTEKTVTRVSHFIMLVRSIYQERIASVGKDADDDMT